MPVPTIKAEICFNADPFPTYFNQVDGPAAAYWRLGEASGNFADSSGGGHTATASGGGFTYAATGALSGDANKAATFGAASYATTTLSPVSADIAFGYSFEFWWKRASNPAASAVVIGGYNNLNIGISSGGLVSMGFAGQDSNLYSVTSNTGSICDGSFHHVVGVWDTASLRIYIDGLLACVPVVATSPPLLSTYALYIGALHANGGGTSSFIGSATLDELAYYTIGLTPIQVQNHYIGAGVSTTQTWTDITSDVINIQITRGRQWELDEMQAATATLTIDNTSRKYDPSYASSPYYPNVLPMRQIRISATYSAVQYWLFTGYVERWPQAWENPDWAEVDMTCVDGFEFLTNAALDGYVTQQDASTQIQAVLDIAGWPRSNRLIFSLNNTVVAAQAFPFDGSQDALSYIQELEQSVGAAFFIGGDGYATWQDRDYRIDQTVSTTSQGTFGDKDDESELLYTALVPSVDTDRVENDVRVTLDQGTYGPGDPTVYAAQDFTSIRQYFRRINTLDTHLYTGSDASNIAAAEILLFKQPGLRFDSMTITPLTNDGLWLQAFNREISDRITVNRRPPGGGTISQDCWIEQFQWNIPAAGSTPWTLTWSLSTAH